MFLFLLPIFTAMAEDYLPNIDKLNSGNWPIWKMQISNYLIARRLWRLCEGHIAAPVRYTGETVPFFVKRQEDYAVMNARVMSILSQTISSQLLYLIASYDVRTPHDAWTVLSSHFELGVESLEGIWFERTNEGLTTSIATNNKVTA